MKKTTKKTNKKATGKQTVVKKTTVKKEIIVGPSVEELNTKIKELEKNLADSNEIRERLESKIIDLEKQLNETIAGAQVKVEDAEARREEIEKKFDVVVELVDGILTKINEYKIQLQKYARKKLFRAVLEDYDGQVFPKIKDILVNKLGLELEGENNKENINPAEENKAVESKKEAIKESTQEEDFNVDDAIAFEEGNIVEESTPAEKTDVENDLNL